MFNLKRKITTQTFSVIEKKKKKKRKTEEERRKKKEEKKRRISRRAGKNQAPRMDGVRTKLKC